MVVCSTLQPRSTNTRNGYLVWSWLVQPDSMIMQDGPPIRPWSSRLVPKHTVVQENLTNNLFIIIFSGRHGFNDAHS